MTQTPDRIFIVEDSLSDATNRHGIWDSIKDGQEGEFEYLLSTPEREAAPCMLEALREALECADMSNRVMAQIIAAIAKAEGAGE